jgi:dienelactone hydrolase
MKHLVLALVCACIASLAHGRRFDPVTFASLERAHDGTLVMLHAILLLPDAAAPATGRPAIVALHGCGGMYSKRKGHESELASRLALRADPLLADGYAVLFVDSVLARGIEQVCTIRHGARTVKIAQRRQDALAALAWLTTRRGIARDRIALLGWSHGGSTALQAVDARNRVHAKPFFLAAVAFYPGCHGALDAGARYRPGAPTRIYIGELDDWTPAATCVALGDEMAVRHEDLLVTTYADSYHGFDSPTGSLVHRIDVPNGVNPGSGVHVGPNAAARESANATVRAFLRERLAPAQH